MAIIYDGPSMIDGSPIVVIVTGYESPSTNTKTGPMLQTYILRSDIPPVAATKSGDDYAICGNCNLKPSNLNACMVVVPQAPSAIYYKYKKGKYKFLSMREIKQLGYRRTVRLGSYGDPSAAPIDIWEHLLTHSIGHTAYTHQWRDFPELKTICMASVDSLKEKQEAEHLGWKTFRIKLQSEKNEENEIPCTFPKLQCTQCLKCDGSGHSITVVVHGSQPKINNFTRWRESCTPIFPQSQLGAIPA